MSVTTLCIVWIVLGVISLVGRPLLVGKERTAAGEAWNAFTDTMLLLSLVYILWRQP